ncbi:MAG: methyltransferase [Nanoarchaeota archaeon]|nr:methyltransferase [Nanoarchaeota archaeon]
MDIYEPAEDSYLLQKVVRHYAMGRILDMGTGSGIQALSAMEAPNTKEIIAVDINQDAVDRLNNEVRERKLRKIKAVHGNLFENLEGHFNVIIFNPPYLPQDKGVDDKAIYGGKKGWELSEQFFAEASQYLFPDGVILFLFSSLTSKDKIEEIIAHNLLEFEEEEKQKVSFETLYVYAVRKTALLRELEGKGLQHLHYFAKGKRSFVYTADLDKNIWIKSHFSRKEKVTVAVKVLREDSQAVGRIENEIKWLHTFMKEGIGPRLLFHGNNYLAYEFVDGVFIADWITQSTKEETRNVLLTILEQCFVMDRFNVNKEEMHHPLKHIIIDRNNHPTLIDFERCKETESPQNVTQLVEFICRMKPELQKKGFTIDVPTLRGLAQEYKETYTKDSFIDLRRQLTL